ncbi:hypothetical protein BKA62DRAFT_801451 [Auriculariales sp. MPI-PUGE-AT-0066]|nr:hypothetical protein BKA62DRAFT_801451 [Auriculariales sp. MPI-PUGE-AT-0066]
MTLARTRPGAIILHPNMARVEPVQDWHNHPSASTTSTTAFHTSGSTSGRPTSTTGHSSTTSTECSSSATDTGAESYTSSAVIVTSGSTTFTTFTTFVPSQTGSSAVLPGGQTIPLEITTSGTVLTTFTVIPASVSPTSPVQTVLPNNSGTTAVCAGHGLDTISTGIVSVAVLSSAIGLLLWLLFALLRPHFRQLYACREWFVPPGLRPEPLSNKPWAFLFPHAPLVPSVPTDVADAGRSPADDQRLFPANTSLAQRTIWVAFLISAGWCLIGLAAALPLYMVNTPCIANTATSPQHHGQYATMQDMSIGSDNSTGDSQQIVPLGGGLQARALIARAAADGPEAAANKNVETRLIILTVLVLLLAVLPALWKLMKEFVLLANYRKRWEDVHCAGIEMAWLSTKNAPGFRGWGEHRIKEYLVKNGLSQSLSRAGSQRRRQTTEGHAKEASGRTATQDEHLPEVDVHGLFTVIETEPLARLIDERDDILNNLEIAETRYINSFSISTPEQSISEAQRIAEESAGHRYKIGRPRALMPYTRNEKGKSDKSRPGDSPLPRNYVAPAQYYKLGHVDGVNGGELEKPQRPELGTTISQRTVGSRFHEMHRESADAGQLLGHAVHVDDAGHLRAGPGPRQRTFSLAQGPNHPDQPVPPSSPHDAGSGEASTSAAAHDAPADALSWVEAGSSTAPEMVGHHRSPTWGTFAATPTSPSSPNGTVGVSEFGVRTREEARERNRMQEVSTATRSTFPMRPKAAPGILDAPDETVPPPHLRIQPHQPFVRPRSGLDHEHLGVIYADIGVWRSRLKNINAEIVEAQQSGYTDIAEGSARVKGYLLIGRGVRFIRGVRMIEGRSKDDVRWDELQRGGGLKGDISFWLFTALIAFVLAIAVTAAVGLALADAPDLAQYLHFFRPIADATNIGSGLATTFAPAVAATLFICIALALVHRASRYSGTPSVTVAELNAFRASFFIMVAICGFWIVSVGAVIFSTSSLDEGRAETQTVSNGTIYVAGFLMVLLMNAAIIAPGLQLLRPFHLAKTLSRQRRAVTPRQRFRAMYPGHYNTTFATGCVVLAVVFAATFSLLFPLITPPLVILLFLTLIAHRFLVGYVYPNLLGSQNGGLIQIWFLRRLASVLCLQPLLLGLMLLSHRVWVLGGISIGSALFIVLFVEAFTRWKLRKPGVKSLSAVTRDSLQKLSATLHRRPGSGDSEETSLVSSSQRMRTRSRGSMASVLEMLNVTLAVMPSQKRSKGPVPLDSDTLDDTIATERAARTHPDAPPHLPPLSFSDHAEETSGILYPPELIAPAPIIWLPNDANGVARSEAYDLQRWHNLAATIDVRAPGDVTTQRRSPPAQAHALQ